MIFLSQQSIPLSFRTAAADAALAYAEALAADCYGRCRSSNATVAEMDALAVEVQKRYAALERATDTLATEYILNGIA